MSEQAAPYWRFRPTPFYDTWFLNGTYSADILGCNWTCENCWSGYGWRGAEEKLSKKRGGGVFTPAQVVDKLIRGMKRNAMSGARITGGEISMRWEDHAVPMIADFIERTSGMRMHVGEDTPPEGIDMGLMVETNGGTLTVGQLDMLDKRLGIEGRRCVIAIGAKASNPLLLSALTGQNIDTAQRFHDNQMRLIRWLALKAENLDWFANFLDEFAEPEEVAKLQRTLERKKGGAGRRIGVDPYIYSYNSNRFYTPKRFRQEGKWFNQASPSRDEEIITKALNKDGTPKDRGDGTVAEQPVAQSRLPLQDFEPEAARMEEFDQATKDLPPGEVRRRAAREESIRRR